MSRLKQLRTWMAAGLFSDLALMIIFMPPLYNYGFWAAYWGLWMLLPFMMVLARIMLYPVVAPNAVTKRNFLIAEAVISGVGFILIVAPDVSLLAPLLYPPIAFTAIVFYGGYNMFEKASSRILSRIPRSRAAIITTLTILCLLMGIAIVRSSDATDIAIFIAQCVAFCAFARLSILVAYFCLKPLLTRRAFNK